MAGCPLCCKQSRIGVCVYIAMLIKVSFSELCKGKSTQMFKTKPVLVKVTAPYKPFLASFYAQTGNADCILLSVISVNINSPLVSDRSSLHYRTYLFCAASGRAVPVYLRPHTLPLWRRVTPPPLLHPLIPADSPLAIYSFTSRHTSPRWIPVASRHGTGDSYAPVSLSFFVFLLCDNENNITSSLN